VLQLATYCQLLEEVSGVFVPEGILVYNHTMHRIPFDPGLRFELESVINKMRACLRTGRVQRNHQDPRRCQHCSMKHHCSDIVNIYYFEDHATGGKAQENTPIHGAGVHDTSFE
jgi:CRISPR-associated exonuclease Cas4